MERVISLVLAVVYLGLSAMATWFVAAGQHPGNAGLAVFLFGCFLMMLGETYGRE